MVGVEIKGRLGNQMFQYAFIKALSIRSGKVFFLYCPIHNQLLLDKYFEVGRSIRYILAVYIGRLLNFLLAKTILKFRSESFSLYEDQPELDKLSDFTIYRGFFQTNKYYSHFTNKNRDFKIRQKYRQRFQERYPDISKQKILVLHMRRGDYKQFYIEDLKDQDFRLPLDYYLKCLDSIDDLNTYHVYIVGDEIDIKENELPCEVSIEKNDMITDFQLMMEANALIISNSSFAWWAAILNKKENKAVYAPKYWVGFKQKIEYPKGIMTPNWNWIEV